MSPNDLGQVARAVHRSGGVAGPSNAISILRIRSLNVTRGAVAATWPDPAKRIGCRRTHRGVIEAWSGRDSLATVKSVRPG